MNQLKEMLDLQDRMNTKVDPNWKETKNPFLRAVAVEGVEGLESLGWKWWKKQTPDRANMRMELIDIWHFILSEAIIQTESENDCIYLLTREHNTTLTWAFDSLSVRRDILDYDERSRWELLIGFAALKAPLYQIVTIFKTLQSDCGLSNDDLYRGYLSKNVLNFFRQDHGYKTGEYVKMWSGEEDNVWLERLATKLGPDLTEASLYAELKSVYATVLDNLALQCEEDCACPQHPSTPETKAGARIVTKDNAKEYLEEVLWNFIDTAGNFPSVSVDPRTWEHVMVYAPKVQSEDPHLTQEEAADDSSYSLKA